MLNKWRNIGLASVLMLAPLAAHASVIASSTFDTDADGWLAGNVEVGKHGTGPVTWQSSGGNPGGYISTTDDFNIVGFVAPSKFLGNQTAAYDGTITFDLQDLYSNSLISDAVLILYGDGKQISIGGTAPSQNGFSSYAFTINEAYFNNYVSGGYQGTDPVTQTELLDVLGNLKYLAIKADFNNGKDLSGLDNVVLGSANTVFAAAIPEPRTLSLFGAGLLGVVALRRRRKN